MHRLLILIIVLGFVAGCSTKQQQPMTQQQPVTTIHEADILAVAEPAMEAKYPEEYSSHKPYIAVPIPGTGVWEVRQSYIPIPAGCPTAIVTDDGRVLMVTLTD